MTVSFALLIAYAALFIAFGWWIGRRAKAADFFVAGRGFGPGLIFSTFLAANIGASSTVGATSLGFAEGLSAWWWNGSAGVGSLILAFSVGPHMWREATTHGDLTLGDFLERRYGRAVRGIVALLIWLGTLTILAAQLLGVAAVLNVIGGFSVVAGCTIGALVTVSYFIAGGLLSSAWVNLVQLVVILVGFAVAAPYAVAHAGGWHTMTEASSPYTDVWFSSGPASGWRLLFLLALVLLHLTTGWRCRLRWRDLGKGRGAEGQADQQSEDRCQDPFHRGLTSFRLKTTVLSEETA